MEKALYSRREFLSFAAGLSVMAGMVSITGCASGGEPIVGTWRLGSSDTALVKFEEDGTLSYTNSYVDEFGVLNGRWYSYASNPVEVDGQKWYVYTTDSSMAPRIPDSTLQYLGPEYKGKRDGWNERSDDIGGGRYQEGRLDLAVKGNLMVGCPGFLLATHNSFDEEKIRNFLSDGPCDWREFYDSYKSIYTFNRT